jgi:hypothetical protein
MGESHRRRGEQLLFVASLPFTERYVDFLGDANAARGINHFTPTGGTAIARLPDGSQIELASETDGRLKAYRHRHDSHFFEIAFETALSVKELRSQALTSAFRISLDDFRDIATGTVSLSRDGSRIVLDWRVHKPEWAQSTGMQTICSFETGNGERVTVRRMGDR